MELQEASDLLKKIVQETLKAKIYRFGFADYTGLGDKTASFGLYNSIQTNITENPGQVVIQLSMIKYGQYVEQGRVSGLKMVPISALVKWIKERHLKGRDKKTGRFITNESFAWGIRKNIQKFGIRPNGQQGKGFADIAINKFMNDKHLDDLILRWADKELDVQLQKIYN